MIELTKKILTFQSNDMIDTDDLLQIVDSEKIKGYTCVDRSEVICNDFGKSEVTFEFQQEK